MRRAFVLRVTPDSDFESGQVDGRVEEVDTGRELKFRSVPDLVAFLSKCLKEDAANEETRETENRHDNRG